MTLIWGSHAVLDVAFKEGRSLLISVTLAPRPIPPSLTTCPFLITWMHQTVLMLLGYNPRYLGLG